MSSGTIFDDDRHMIAYKLVKWLTEYAEFNAELSVADDPMQSLQKVVGDCAAEEATALKKIQVLEGLVTLLRSEDHKARGINP
jgi:hypothetical protein